MCCCNIFNEATDFFVGHYSYLIHKSALDFFYSCAWNWLLEQVLKMCTNMNSILETSISSYAVGSFICQGVSSIITLLNHPWGGSLSSCVPQTPILRKSGRFNFNWGARFILGRIQVNYTEAAWRWGSLDVSSNIWLENSLFRTCILLESAN